MIKIILSILLLILIFIFYSPSTFLNEYPKNEISYKDSLLITNALYKIANKEVDFNLYKWFPDLNFKSKYFKYNIENVYKSPDNLKAIAFISYNYQNNSNGNLKLENNMFYAGIDMALLRKSQYEPWDIYYLGYCISSGWKYRDELRFYMENYYRNGIKSQTVEAHSDKFTFQQILEKEGYILDSNNLIGINPSYIENEQIDLSNNIKLSEYVTTFKNLYGLDDKEFWTESFIWKKGLRLPDLYIFQTDSHIIMEGYILNYKIQYPDSIIQMYKEK